MISHRRRLTIAVTAGILASAAFPALAHAATIYPPVDSCTVDPATASAGGTIAFSCAAASFGANEPVTITVTGENGAEASFAFVHFAVSTASAARTSRGDGSLGTVNVTLPAGAIGVYNIAAVSPSSAGGAASASIVGADGLPTTGGDSGQLLGVWIGGGALVLAGVIVLVTRLVRSRRERHDD